MTVGLNIHQRHQIGRPGEMQEIIARIGVRDEALHFPLRQHARISHIGLQIQPPEKRVESVLTLIP